MLQKPARENKDDTVLAIHVMVGSISTAKKGMIQAHDKAVTNPSKVWNLRRFANLQKVNNRNKRNIS